MLKELRVELDNRLAVADGVVKLLETVSVLNTLGWFEMAPGL